MANDAKDKVYRVYAICPRENDKPFWLNIGLAFPHKDGKGFNLQLQALPLDDKIVIREYDPAEAEQSDANAGEQLPPASKSKVKADKG